MTSVSILFNALTAAMLQILDDLETTSHISDGEWKKIFTFEQPDNDTAIILWRGRPAIRLEVTETETTGGIQVTTHQLYDTPDRSKTN
jgi:hypothetical protein